MRGSACWYIRCIASRFAGKALAPAAHLADLNEARGREEESFYIMRARIDKLNEENRDEQRKRTMRLKKTQGLMRNVPATGPGFQNSDFSPSCAKTLQNAPAFEPTSSKVIACSDAIRILHNGIVLGGQAKLCLIHSKGWWVGLHVK
jgi:hypothetical protein